MSLAEQVKALREQIRSVESNLAELKKSLRTLENEEWKEFNERERTVSRVWKYTATVKITSEEGSSFDRLPAGIEMVTLFRELANPEVLKALYDEYGRTYDANTALGGNRERQSSLKYFRYNGSLGAVGGGYMMLKTPTPCSDEDWENLKKGIIAGHLLNPQVS